MAKHIWAFAGGKGGVGKSIISSNIAILLAEKNNRVVIIDADFGAANVHTCLGLPAPRTSLIDFFSGGISNLNNCVVPTFYSNLYIISGAQDSLEIANPKQEQIVRFIQAIAELQADYVIVDLGAGTSQQIIDVFNAAHKGILVTMPEPTSIENTYRFIKHAIYRKFRKVIHYQGVRDYLEKISSSKENQRQMSPNQLIQEITRINADAGAVLNNEIKSMDINLLLNQVISNRDIRLGVIMKNSCLKHFGVVLNYTGVVENDKNVLIASRERKPITIYNPFSAASRSIRQLQESLVNGEQLFLSI
jgi:flagellar biosynthesis protein FlhG